MNIEGGLDGLIAWVLQLRKEVGIQHTLAEIGIPADETKRIGEMAVLDPSAGGNPIQFTHKQYTQIFECALHGRNEND